MGIVTDGLVGYWNSKQGVNGGRWNNISPHANGKINGVINGAVVQANGMYFDGVDDNITFSEPLGLQKQSFTLEAWVLVSSSSPKLYNGIITRNSGISEMLKYDSRSTYAEKFTYYFSGYKTTTRNFKTGQLIHIVLAYDSSLKSFSIYTNNILDGISSNDSTFIPEYVTPWTIGGHDVTYFFKGHIPVVRIYNRALTPEEISQNYSVGREVGLIEDEELEPPMVTITSMSHYKVSNVLGFDLSTVRFKFNAEVTEWRINLLGVSYDTGVILDYGGSFISNTEIFGVIQSSLLHQEGQNRINIYGKGVDGVWTPYAS